MASYLCPGSRVITHLQPDILECEVKWALGSITVNKGSGGDGIPGLHFCVLFADCHTDAEVLSECW